MVPLMIFTISHSLGKIQAWDLFTTNEFVTKWLAKESNINWKKNGKVNLIIEPSEHEITGCKLIVFEPPQRIEMTWKGPEEFDITMNFEDYLTHIEITFQDKAIVLEHKGWRSSEDWQQAKSWHEKVFWPEKIALLSNLLKQT